MHSSKGLPHLPSGGETENVIALPVAYMAEIESLYSIVVVSQIVCGAFIGRAAVIKVTAVIVSARQRSP